MTEIEFFVEGEAATAGSKDAIPLGTWTVENGVKRFHPRFRESGMPIVNVVDSVGAKGKAWRKTVVKAAEVAMKGHEIMGGPIEVEATFYRRRNVADLGTGRNAGLVKPSAPAFPITMPDTTKLFRALEDALTGIVWHDDAQVVEQIVRKRWATPGSAEGVQVRISSIATLSSDPVPESEGAQLTL